MSKRKYAFDTTQHMEATIRDTSSRELIGVIRIKPSSILWKPSGRHTYHWKSFDDFMTWIEGTSTKDVRK